MGAVFFVSVYSESYGECYVRIFMTLKLHQMEEIFRHLAGRVEQARPLHDAFAEVAGLAEGAQRREIGRMAERLKQGEALEGVLKNGGCSWPEQYKQLLVYGAEHDSLAVMFRMASDVAAYEQQSNARRSLALAYPVMGIAVAILCFFFMAGGCVVAGSQIFGETFPFPDRYRGLLSVLGFSWGTWVVAGAGAASLFVGGVCFWPQKRKKSSGGQISGRSRYWLDMALASRVTSRMTRQNMPLPICVRAAAQVVRTIAISNALRRLADQLEQGNAVDGDSGSLDPLFAESLEQGGGSLCDNLFSLAELYTVRMHESVTRQTVRIGAVAAAVLTGAVFTVLDFFMAFYVEFINGIGNL